MGSLVNFIVPIAIPVLCLILVFILFSYVHNYSTSIKKNCQDVLKFADDLEESLADIGIFNRQNEAMIVRGEVTCKHINEENLIGMHIQGTIISRGRTESETIWPDQQKTG